MPSLDTELKTYEQNRNNLLGTAEGKFALIHNTQVIGIYDSKMDAICAGYQQFGNVPFLVKQILKVEAPLNFISNLLGVDVPSFASQVPNLQDVGPIVDLRIVVGTAVEAAVVRGIVESGYGSLGQQDCPDR